MNEGDVKQIQAALQKLGLYEGQVDGIWGKRSKAAFDALVNLAELRNDAQCPMKLPNADKSKMAWGAKVDKAFREKVSSITNALGMNYGGAESDLMTAMAFETGETFSPSVMNAAGSGAVGLIQFMPNTARSLGTSTEKLAAMTDLEQLDYVYRYLLPYKGRLKNVGDVYMAILWPAGIGKGPDYVLWDKDTRPTTYRQNAGLDSNRDNTIVRGEVTAKIEAMRVKGLLPENVA